jgi:hypothetical protein
VFKQNKSEKHLELERALQSIKLTVLELMAPNSLAADEAILLQRLRNDTSRIIRELNDEIKCEKKIIVWKHTIARDARSSSDHRMDILMVVLSCMMFCLVKALHRAYRQPYE